MSSKKKEEIYKDERFAHLINNPRFKKLPTKEGKVKIDDRFKSMFKDKKFKVKYSVNKYGRQVNSTSTEDLKKYYEQSSEESSEEEEEKEPKEDEDLNGNAIIEGGQAIPETLKDKLKNLEVDYIRGEGVLQSDSSDEETSDEDDEITIEHVWGELDHDAEKTDESSKRIACMHMDWDRIRAVDIMMMLNSFIPSGSGTILSVKIYPSEFGKERMAQEEVKGPQELTAGESQKNDNDEEVDEEDEGYKEKLREYQLNRLKYYYAVIEFDSVKCADIVYKECDGLEYESTANRLDLRFIPDEMEFDDEPKDVCTELPERAKYQPRLFFTTALQQAKVELTWDETDVGRKELTDKLFTDKRSEITDYDLRKFVACSSSEEGEEIEEKSDDLGSETDEDTKPKNKIDLYKSLLQEINQKEEDKKKKQIEMEFSWGVGADRKDSEDESAESDKEELTPFEKILEKKKLKKKAKKAARKKKFKGDNDDEDEANDDDEKGYSSSDFDDIDMNDPYFAEEFANQEFKMPKKLSKTKKKKNKKAEVASDDEEKLNAQKELELLLDDGSEDKAHFSLKKIQENETMTSSKRKRRLKKSKKDVKAAEPIDNFELNVKDDRFNAIYSKADFNIDPTDPNFKKTKGMDVLIHEKLKRRFNDDDGSASTSNGNFEKKQKTKDVALNILVKSIKRKAGK